MRDREIRAGTLVGAGALLLNGCLPAPGGRAPESARTPSPESWDGPDGIGDYAGSNGNRFATQAA